MTRVDPHRVSSVDYEGQAREWLDRSLRVDGTALDVMTAQVFATLAVVDTLNAIASFGIDQGRATS